VFTTGNIAAYTVKERMDVNIGRHLLKHPDKAAISKIMLLKYWKTEIWRHCAKCVCKDTTETSKPYSTYQQCSLLLHLNVNQKGQFILCCFIYYI